MCAQSAAELHGINAQYQRAHAVSHLARDTHMKIDWGKHVYSLNTMLNT